MAFKTGVTRKDGIDLKKVIEDLTGMVEYVGIPEKNTSRQGEQITNAALLFIHTNGSDLQGIPARPVIEPAIETNKQPIADQLGLAANAALEGDKVKAGQRLDFAGQLAENFARGWFTDPRNGWAPNTPATIARKGSDRPLIDTGDMRKSITHVRKNG